MAGGRHLLVDGDRTGFCKEIAIPSYAINPPGEVSDPGRSKTTGLLEFDGAATEMVAGVVYMPHGYKPNSPIRPHLHIRASDGIDPGTGPDNITTWFLEYKWYSCGEALPVSYTEDTINIILPAHIDGQPVATGSDTANFTLISATNKDCSSIFEWRLSRLGGSDSYPGDCSLLQFCIHYTCYKLGDHSM